ncbi:MAG TPA: hypothetical protein VK272_03965 [Solirubrobacteraceae bacterium]|nr:hypothetical protein [Solirubrobacteraceae bacterium]
MSDARNLAINLRERFSGGAEERLGKALSDLLENPLLTGAIGRAFDAREKAVQAQEVAMGALNIPSAADIERLTRRVRSVSNRLEGIEDGVDRLDRTLAPAGAGRSEEMARRLSAIEEQLERLTQGLDQALGRQPAASAGKPAGPARAAKAAKPAQAGAGARSATVAKPSKAGKAGGSPKAGA